MKTARSWVVVLGLFCLLAVGSARADVYKCTVNGVLTYSALPCGADATVVKTGEHMITFSSDMSGADMQSFCALIMRAHDDSKANASNNGFYNNYGWGGYYDHSQKEADFILSHVSNLKALARNEPEMYRYVVQMASSGGYGWRRSSYRDDSDREAEMSECRAQLSNYLSYQQRSYDRQRR